MGDNGDGDGSVTDLRSGWITSDHNAPTVVESGRRQLGQTLANCYSEYRVSLLRTPMSNILTHKFETYCSCDPAIADGGSMMLNARHK